jgi:hypothetical protein
VTDQRVKKNSWWVWALLGLVAIAFIAALGVRSVRPKDSSSWNPEQRPAHGLGSVTCAEWDELTIPEQGEVARATISVQRAEHGILDDEPSEAQIFSTYNTIGVGCIRGIDPATAVANAYLANPQSYGS